jgi:hypothetical protein
MKQYFSASMENYFTNSMAEANKNKPNMSMQGYEFFNRSEDLL